MKSPVPLTARGRALVLIDGANLRCHLQGAALTHVDGSCLPVWARQFGRPTVAWFEGAYPHLTRFFNHLRAAGVEVATKPVKTLPGGRRKADMDGEMFVAALDRADRFATIVLVTADGDFACLAATLQAKGVHVIVVAPKGATAHELTRTVGAENVLDLNAELPSFGFNPGQAA